MGGKEEGTMMSPGARTAAPLQDGYRMAFWNPFPWPGVDAPLAGA